MVFRKPAICTLNKVATSTTPSSALMEENLRLYLEMALLFYGHLMLFNMEIVQLQYVAMELKTQLLNSNSVLQK
jgi:hypothetical protein